MRPWTSTITIAAPLCSLAAPLHAQTPRSAEWTWTGAVPTGRTVTIDAVRADVRVLPAFRGQVEVRVILHGKNSPPQSVAMVVDTTSRGLGFRTRYGGHRPVQPVRRRECLPADPLHGDFWYSDVRADVTLRVPPGVPVVVRVMWGDIEVAGVRNPLDLYTQNGRVH